MNIAQSFDIFVTIFFSQRPLQKCLLSVLNGKRHHDYRLLCIRVNRCQQCPTSVGRCFPDFL